MAAAAKEYFLPIQRLRVRRSGRKSKKDWIPENRRLLEYQELALCSHLNCLGKIGLPVCLFIIADCEILFCAAITRVRVPYLMLVNTGLAAV
jgi:hypothetical protein